MLLTARSINFNVVRLARALGAGIGSALGVGVCARV
jgi:hypothetical protein